MDKRKKILFIIALVLFVVIPIVLFLIQRGSETTPGSKTVIIDNKGSYSRGVNEDVFTAIGSTAYGAISLNITPAEDVYHGTIRKDSFTKSNGTVSFILDIPSIEYSWEVHQAIERDGGTPISDALVVCVPREKAIYPVKTNCTDATNYTDQSIENTFEIGKDLPLTGQNYVVNYTYTQGSDNPYTVVISYYGESGKQEALDALISLGYNPDDYTISYKTL